MKKLISPSSRLLRDEIVFGIGAGLSGAGLGITGGVIAGGADSVSGADATGGVTGTGTEEDFLRHPHEKRSTSMTA
jgi:hypothetical protein